MTAWDYALWISVAAITWLIGRGAGYFKGYAAGRADADETRIVLSVSGQSIGSLSVSGVSIHPGTKIRLEGT